MKIKKVKIPQGYSIRIVHFKNNTLFIHLDKDKVEKGAIRKIVPTRVIQGL